MPIPAQQFLVPAADNGRAFNVQYAGLYFSRLALQRPRALAALREQAKKDGGKAKQGKRRRMANDDDADADADAADAADDDRRDAETEAVRVLDVPPSRRSVTAGTVFVESRRKPSVLRLVTPHASPDADTNDNDNDNDNDASADVLLLEDESGRVQLRLAPAPAPALVLSRGLVSGVVAAVAGSLDPVTNCFDVARIAFPSFAAAPSPPVASRVPPAESRDALVALVSGFNINSPAISTPLRLLIDALSGDSVPFKN
ncbi:hypothetical protein HK100_010578, partial [Physocladia obscura]